MWIYQINLCVCYSELFTPYIQICRLHLAKFTDFLRLEQRKFSTGFCFLNAMTYKENGTLWWMFVLREYIIVDRRLLIKPLISFDTISLTQLHTNLNTDKLLRVYGPLHLILKSVSIYNDHFTNTGIQSILAQHNRLCSEYYYNDHRQRQGRTWLALLIRVFLYVKMALWYHEKRRNML